MYNAHSYAVSIEKIVKAHYQTANEIEKDPLGYLKVFLMLSMKNQKKRQG